MERRRVAIWLLLVALFAGPAGACGLQVDLLYTAERLEAPPASAPVLYRAEAASAGEHLRVRLPRRSTGHWLRLSCSDRLPADTGWLFLVEGAEQLGELTLYPPGAAPRRLGPAGRSGSPGHAATLRHGWWLALPHGWPASSVAYLHVQGTSTEPLRLRVMQASQLEREMQAGARQSAGVAAVLLAFAVAMAGIYLRFRDLLYLSYAAYLFCIASYVLLLGDPAAAGVLEPFLVHGATGRWAVATLAVILQLVFTRRILELDRVAPKASRLLQLLFWLHLGLLATLLAERTQVHGWYCTAGNALLIASAPTVLGIAGLAWRRGATYAGYYLLGWTPLVASAALVAADQLGLVSAPWAEAMLPLVAVAESVVLAFALSRHAASRGWAFQTAPHARERDPVTGAFSAQALERMLESWHPFGGPGARRYSLLMLDLEPLAAIAERQGNAVADVLLRQSAARLRARLEPDDIVARIGPNRFAVLRKSGPQAADSLARQLADAVAATPYRVDRQVIALSASVGAATAMTGEPVGPLMQRARQALQRGQASRGNPVDTVGGRPALSAFAAARPGFAD